MGSTSFDIIQQHQHIGAAQVQLARQRSSNSRNTRESNANAAPYAGYSDEELVRLAQNEDAPAFGELVQRHFTVCLSRAFLILRNRCDAEDEVQNAFSKAFESLNQFSFRGTFSAWLCRIVQNQCLMLIRDRRQSAVLSVDAQTKSNARLELVNQKPDQEEDLGARQVDTLLQNEISHIPPLMRNVIVLRDVEGRPMPEVAMLLGLTVPAAKSRLMRARKELRSRLKKHCGRSGPRTLTHKAGHAKAEYTYVS
jgi:RNA polymerase sigma-70 factor, ECF subfamily